jgi:hypothetical protein
MQDAPGGVNTSLPRLPYLPWDQRWWTRMFDAGIKYVRIGQYEDTSDITGWDWVEHEKGHFTIKPELDLYVDSLVDNGTIVQLQLLYGNPIYTSPAGILPHSITPTPGSVHNRDLGLYSIFWPPKTPDQIQAFLRYAKWMVNHFRGRVRYYTLWNEQDGSYWNLNADPEEYGRLLGAFVQAVRETDTQAKVVYGGQASLDTDFARRALSACQCAAGIDVFAYHTYPGGYVTNAPPETMDSGAFGERTTTALRKAVSSYPGVRPDIQFWDDEYNSLPAFSSDMSEAIQAKYVPRTVVYNWAAGVQTYLWELMNDTSTSEGDNFGIIHGMMHRAEDFQPRPVFHTLARTNALFADTVRDASIEVNVADRAPLESASQAPFFAYGFRSRGGKVIVAYWLGERTHPKHPFEPVYVDLILHNTGIVHPVLIDIDSDRISAIAWEAAPTFVLRHVPVRDSVMAIADESYFDWAVLPEIPAPLRADVQGAAVKLTWPPSHDAERRIVVERRVDPEKGWMEVKTLPGNASYEEREDAKVSSVAFRVRAANASGKSGYSNVETVVLSGGAKSGQ